ncbi:MAG TPA: hypothetical protein ENN11_00575 [Methanomicrobia archaeon]|nr:hypothetical protein [Methanomicrobia archaeon]
MQRKLSILLALCLVTALVAGCISSDEPESTTTAPPDTYYLSVTVDGGSPIEVGLSEIKSLEYATITATMVKKTGAEIETTWGGISFYGFMEHIGVEDAETVTMIALDGYQKELEYAQLQQAMLAWHDENGDTIPEEDGGPIRFVAPGLPANTWMQNLVEIQVTAAPQDTASLTVTVDGTSSDVGLSELQSLEYTSLTADDVEWGGALISDLMAHLGIDDATTVTFFASDGYNKEAAYVDLTHAIIAWYAGGEEIAEEEGGPLRIIAPSLSKSNWVGNLVEIEVVTGG